MELNGYHAWFSDVSAILLIVLLDGGLNKSKVGHARTGLVWIVISVGMRAAMRRDASVRISVVQGGMKDRMRHKRTSPRSRSCSTSRRVFQV